MRTSGASPAVSNTLTLLTAPPGSTGTEVGAEGSSAAPGKTSITVPRSSSCNCGRSGPSAKTSTRSRAALDSTSMP